MKQWLTNKTDKMVNFLKLAEHPQIDHEVYFAVMRDYRKGGLTPTMFDEFINLVRSLPPAIHRIEKDYEVFSKFNLVDISEAEFPLIAEELQRRNLNKSKKCWHPLASTNTCKTNENGEIIISAAHSLQNNGILSKIATDGEVTTYSRVNPRLAGKKQGKKISSTFWGFCNTHDAIFYPIETSPYSGNAEQHFLFAYRGFIVAVHKKIEALNSNNFGDQAINDIIENKKIFDRAIQSSDFGVISTHVIDLPVFYPIAATSAFYLDFDYFGREIIHSEERMENIFITLIPDGQKSKFMISYFTQDVGLYGALADQIRDRGKWRSDLSVLLGHTENIYFQPLYFESIILPQAQAIKDFMFATQTDYGLFDENDQAIDLISMTPKHIMDNPYELNFFAY